MEYSSPTFLAIGASALAVAYLVTVRSVRWRAYNNVHRRFLHKINSLNIADAQEIIHLSTSWDMPLIIMYSLSFTILRTYGVPSMSRVLMNTGELKDGSTVARRLIDTAIAVSSWVGSPIDLSAPPSSLVAAERKHEDPTVQGEPDPRAFIAVSRMNWLHARYPIRNDDLLLTLSYFINEPPKWAQKYGWRELSALEQEAYFVFYKHIGEMMKIKGIPDTLEGMKEWAEGYEQEYMVPAEVNNKMVHGMLQELSEGVPPFVKPLVTRLLICLFDDRVRTAMMLPEQPAWVHAVLKVFTRSLAFINRHLLLPKSEPFSLAPLPQPKTPSDGSLARMHPNLDVSKPWYKEKPGVLGMSLEYVKVAFGIRSWDDLPDPKYRQEGYRLEEIGPSKYEDVGHDDVMRGAAQLMGCPVSGMWARPRNGK